MKKVAYDGAKSGPNERLLPGEPPQWATGEKTPYHHADPYFGKPKADPRNPYSPGENGNESAVTDSVSFLLKDLYQNSKWQREFPDSEIGAATEGEYLSTKQLSDKGVSSGTISKAVAKGLVTVEDSLGTPGEKVVTLTEQGRTAHENQLQSSGGDPYTWTPENNIKKDEAGKPIPNAGIDRPIPRGSKWDSKNLKKKLNRGTGMEGLEDDVNHMLASVRKELRLAKKDSWMPGWVARNCKFAQSIYDPPMSDPQYDNAEDPPEDVGPKAHDKVGFMKIFKDWVQEPDNWPYYQEFIKVHAPRLVGIHGEMDITPDMAWEFLSEGDVPEWAQDYCAHQYEQQDHGDWKCLKCGHDSHQEAAQDRADFHGDQQYDQMVENSL
jgi:hypothetical protein